MLSFNNNNNNNKECVNLTGGQSLKEKRTTSEQSLVLPLTAEKCCGRPVFCPRTPGVMAARPSALEKLPQKSVTNKERKRKELCLPLNEAKNGKRVRCRSGTQPAFSKWGRLNFPTSSQLKTTFKTTRPPHTPSAARSLSSSHMEG